MVWTCKCQLKLIRLLKKGKRTTTSRRPLSKHATSPMRICCKICASYLNIFNSSLWLYRQEAFAPLPNLEKLARQHLTCELLSCNEQSYICTWRAASELLCGCKV